MIEKLRFNQGTCSQAVRFMVDEEGIIQAAEFYGGCDGNLKGICKLIPGMKASEVADLLRGTTCGYKSTSCPDQLALAIDELLTEHPELPR